MSISDEELIELATQARERAYAPYSKFKVGAALLTVDGAVYTGCNVENAVYSLTMCAERIAIFRAASEGGLLRIKKMAVIGRSPEPLTPCGCCRQMIWEFGTADTLVIMSNTVGQIRKLPLSDLLPHPVDSSFFA